MTMTIHFELNGRSVSFDGDPETPLLWAVRDDFGLTGTKYGCGVAQCGACTVHLAGKPLRSCVTPVALVAAKRVTTIEGVNGALAEAVRAAWVKLDVPQCGYCQSGQIMAAIALLSESPRPTDAEIDAALAGNICRCAAYQRIRRAIHAAAQSSSA
jgi:isoquinoline 1-oxidoreductase alpha subunit